MIFIWMWSHFILSSPFNCQLGGKFDQLTAMENHNQMLGLACRIWLSLFRAQSTFFLNFNCCYIKASCVCVIFVCFLNKLTNWKIWYQQHTTSSKQFTNIKPWNDTGLEPTSHLHFGHLEISIQTISHYIIHARRLLMYAVVYTIFFRINLVFFVSFWCFKDGSMV